MSTDFHTLSVIAGLHDDPFGAVIPPIYATSTYRQQAPGEHSGYEYSRSQNPTREALERPSPTGGSVPAFGSGLAAIATVLDLLPAGSTSSSTTCTAAVRLFDRVRSQSAGLSISYVPSDDPAALEAAIQPNTRMLWVETPSNPLNRLADLAQLADIARRHQLLAVADNTFASPVIQQPLGYGFDIVLHSATSLNGHLT
jgi:cystathionine gamma-lyase